MAIPSPQPVVTKSRIGLFPRVASLTKPRLPAHHAEMCQSRSCLNASAAGRNRDFAMWGTAARTRLSRLRDWHQALNLPGEMPQFPRLHHQLTGSGQMPVAGQPPTAGRRSRSIVPSPFLASWFADRFCSRTSRYVVMIVATRRIPATRHEIRHHHPRRLC